MFGGAQTRNMLNCREITERASDFLDGSLSWPVRLELRMHLAMCRFCREYVRQLSLVMLSLHRLPRHEVSDDTRQRLLALFRAEQS